jgi:hypothetical protein
VALKLFLAYPDRFASGTSMPSLGPTPQQIELVARLERLEEAAQRPARAQEEPMIIEPRCYAIDRAEPVR